MCVWVCVCVWVCMRVCIVWKPDSKIYMELQRLKKIAKLICLHKVILCGINTRTDRKTKRIACLRMELNIHMPMHTCKCSQLCPTLQLHGLQPAKLLCSWNFSGKNTRGLLFPPPGDYRDPGIKRASPVLVGRFFTSLSPEVP